MTATPDLSQGTVQHISPTAAVEVQQQSGGVAGRRYTLRIVQGETGYPVTFSATYIGIPDIPTTPNTYSCLPLEIDTSGNAYLCAAPVLGVPLP